MDIKFIHSNGHFLLVNNFNKLTTPTFNEKQLTYQNNRGFQSSGNTKPRQIITSILYMIFYATECVRVGELYDIEAQFFFSNSKTQARPPLCHLFLLL